MTLPPLTDYAAMTLAELLHTGSVAADLRARDVITQADFLHRSDIVIAALMVVRLDAELKVARERLAALLLAPTAAGAAEPGNAHTWTARLVEQPATTWRELSRDPFYLWETDQFIARVEAEPESIAWNWHAEAGDQDADGVAFSADEAKRAAEQWIAGRVARGGSDGAS